MDFQPNLNESQENSNNFHNNDLRPYTAVVNKRKIIRAKNIFIDSEKLYNEALILKKQINILKEENIKLKTKVLSLEKELHKAPILINGQHRNNVIVNLKQNIRNLRQLVRDKEEEIDKMRRSLKFTRQQEMEVIIQSYIDENKRLKHMLEEVMKQQVEGHTSPINSKKFEREFKLKTLKKENQDLLEILSNNERENQAMRIKLLELEAKKTNNKQSKHKEELKKMKNTNQTLLQQIYDKDQKFQQLQDQMKQIEDDNNKNEADQNEKIMKYSEQISLKSELVEKLMKERSAIQNTLDEIQSENFQFKEKFEVIKEQSQQNQMEQQSILLQLMQLQKQKSNFLSKTQKIKNVLNSMLSLKQKMISEKKEVQQYMESFKQSIDDLKINFCN